MTIQADRLFLACTSRIARQQDVGVEDDAFSELREQIAMLADLVQRYKESGKLSPEKITVYEAKVASLQHFLEKKSKEKKKGL